LANRGVADCGTPSEYVKYTSVRSSPAPSAWLKCVTLDFFTTQNSELKSSVDYNKTNGKGKNGA